MGLESQFCELRVLSVVVVFLGLNSRVRYGHRLDIEAELLTRFRDEGRELVHRELLRELVKDAKLAPIGGVCDGKLDALDSVSYVEISSRLFI